MKTKDTEPETSKATATTAKSDSATDPASPTAATATAKAPPEAERGCLDFALDYAADGVKTVPLYGLVDGVCECRKGAACRSSGKHPRLTGWQQLATTDSAVICSWWDCWPNSNVGLPMGHPYRDTGLVLIALDIDGDEGESSLDELELSYETLPATLTNRTGSGSRQLLWLVLPDEAATLKNYVKRRPGLDLRVLGGQIAVAPSMHISGNRYRWEGEEGEYKELAEIPTWLLAEFKQWSNERRDRDASTKAEIQRRKDNPFVQRELRRIGAAPDEDAERTLLDLCTPSPDGSRHEAGVWWACEMRDHGAGLDRTHELAPEFHERTLAARPDEIAGHDFALEELEEIVFDTYRMVEPTDQLREAARQQPWRAGKRKVYDALLQLAVRAVDFRFFASVRTVAQLARCGKGTVSDNAKALEADGWISRRKNAGLHNCTEWTLQDRSLSRTRSSIANQSDQARNLLVRPRERDAFEHGGIPHTIPTLELLLDNPGSTLAEVHRLSTLKSKSGVLKHLKTLEEFGLAHQDESGKWTADHDDLDAKLARVTEQRNLEGRGEAREQRHETERKYRRIWEELN